MAVYQKQLVATMKGSIEEQTAAMLLIAHIHRSILATIERSKTKPPKKIRRAKSVVQIV
jgi:hypothetical protein